MSLVAGCLSSGGVSFSPPNGCAGFSRSTETLISCPFFSTTKFLSVLLITLYGPSYVSCGAPFCASFRRNTNGVVFICLYTNVLLFP